MTYLEELKAATAKEQAERLQQKIVDDKNTVAAWQHAMIPLDQRLKKVLDEMPESVKAAGIRIKTLQIMLKGRWRGRAHAGELGSALRKLGYTRSRDWSNKASSYGSLWRKL